MIWCISSIRSSVNKYIGNYKSNQNFFFFLSNLFFSEDYLSKYKLLPSLLCAIFKHLCLLFGLKLQFWSFELGWRKRMNSNIKKISSGQEFLFLLIIVKSNVGSWACYSVILTFICFQCSIQYKTRYIDCKNKKEHEDKYNYMLNVVKTLYSMDGAQT